MDERRPTRREKGPDTVSQAPSSRAGLVLILRESVSIEVILKLSPRTRDCACGIGVVVVGIFSSLRDLAVVVDEVVVVAVEIVVIVVVSNSSIGNRYSDCNIRR